MGTGEGIAVGEGEAVVIMAVETRRTSLLLAGINGVSVASVGASTKLALSKAVGPQPVVKKITLTAAQATTFNDTNTSKDGGFMS
jgi:hypothetical protein